jgi:hypothetical protein
VGLQVQQLLDIRTKEKRFTPEGEAPITDPVIHLSRLYRVELEGQLKPVYTARLF